ncbi:hypothetical protein DUNSADRAFT_8550 [Dunaliella salina]|uniref:[histone H3]-lysine(4) N-trimethyltransferase n=1 Tax=Dunaliella salina TaxID=3046 RepID=A0ABQ7GJE7_DUNSA|nr:hypothetical protein DUNSADRAFT_8550 [Dunaliella salina]|eukprot:KAF5834668.1 hypothetical protein DUNSADRAFT_8550 [Dunaliella salina]
MPTAPPTSTHSTVHTILVEALTASCCLTGIHGWGIFALRSIPQDSLVAEYRGEIVRNSMADHRETQYREGGQDCYLFRVNDDVVVDSTNCGGISRFCNHCCMPSLYTRVINDANNNPHVAFYAKTDLKPGQELTFDYRFKEEAGDKVRCECGAPNCKGSLN